VRNVYCWPKAENEVTLKLTIIDLSGKVLYLIAHYQTAVGNITRSHGIYILLSSGYSIPWIFNTFPCAISPFWLSWGKVKWNSDSDVSILGDAATWRSHCYLLPRRPLIHQSRPRAAKRTARCTRQSAPTGHSATGQLRSHYLELDPASSPGTPGSGRFLPRSSVLSFPPPPPTRPNVCICPSPAH